MQHDDLFGDADTSSPAIAKKKAVATQSQLTDFRGYARMGYIAIIASFGGFGAWAATAPLDSAAVAQGQVAVTSDRKPVQHFEGGIVKEVLVKENQPVKAGQVLFRLQSTQAQSNADILSKQLDGLLAQEARHLAERDGKRLVFPQVLLDRRNEPAVASTLYDQEKQFTERKRGQDGLIEVQRYKIEQQNADIAGKRQREAAMKLQLGNLRTEIAAVTTLADKGFFPRNKMLQLQRELFRMEGDHGQLLNDIMKAFEIIEQAKAEIRNITQKRIEEGAKELGDVRGKLSDTREKLGVALDVLKRIDIVAPQDGILQGLKVQTIGAVVKGGEPMAEIITKEDGLIMTAKVSPQDIDMVMAGQKAEIKFPAFTTRQRLATMGRVESVSADAVIDPASKQPFYNARVIIDMSTLPKELHNKLTPGMPASVLINTGERTMLMYLVGPLFDAIARTMRER